jgi:hypothetical protein
MVRESGGGEHAAAVEVVAAATAELERCASVASASAALRQSLALRLSFCVEASFPLAFAVGKRGATETHSALCLRHRRRAPGLMLEQELRLVCLFPTHSDF